MRWFGRTARGRSRWRAGTLVAGVLLAGLADGARAQQIVRMPGAGAPAGPPSVARIVNILPEAPNNARLGGRRVEEWTPLITQAATRFGIPEAWIREVMRMESGGNPQALSWAGAMGLMQVIPSTYARMRWQHGLGPNPWEPRDNILAGAAYIREMYDLYGFPAFLAAYNAGPGRVEGFINNRSVLPAETVNYLSVLAPRLQGSTTAEGPLAAFLNPHGAAASQPAHAAGPLRIDMRRPNASAAASLADANGLVPRGMLHGPQRIQMPSAPGTGTLAAPVPLPPAIVASLLRAAAR